MYRLIFLMTFSSLWGSLNTIIMTGGAIMATIGLVRIFMKFNSGETRNLENDIYIWLGGGLLLGTASYVATALFL